MDEAIKNSAMIKTEALRLGFTACGIARAMNLEQDAKYFDHWLKEGMHGAMSYMENNFEMRTDPAKIFDGAQSVIAVLLNYYTKKTQADPLAPIISKYAYGNDYHKVIKKKLRHLLAFINKSIQPARGRAFVDSAPVLDRAWAARAGLGWIGKNSNLISLKHGSFVFIGTLIVDIPLAYDNPILDFCGSCNRCIKACPTSAIVKDKVVDARKCISYLTIELKSEIPEDYRGKLINRIFGCDICQDVCPWNRKSTPHKVEEFEPVPGLLEMTRSDWHKLNEEKYKQLFNESAVKRANYAKLKDNLNCIAETNSG